MDAVSLLRDQFKQAHGTLEATMADVTPEQAHWLPPGKANPLGANYAHVVIEEDALINGMLKGGAPLFATTFAGKAGVSDIMPLPSPDVPGVPAWDEWARRVKLDLPAFKAYAQAVEASAEEYVSSLSDEAANASLDLSGFGLGQRTVAWFVANIVLWNVISHGGEISCLKGLQGAKGYPM